MSVTLRFRDDKTFTIVQFTDIHWHNGEPVDRQTADLMAIIVDQAAPDLVALTGDTLSGGNCKDPRTSLNQAVAVFEERRVPWAMVFGNHDYEGSVSREGLMDTMTACSMSLAEPGPRDISGVGNYVLRVKSSHGEDAVRASIQASSRPCTRWGMSWAFSLGMIISTITRATCTESASATVAARAITPMAKKASRVERVLFNSPRESAASRPGNIWQTAP